MAGDWIKMRTDLYRDPKIIVMADLLLNQGSGLARYVSQNTQRDCNVTRNVMRNAVVGALVSVWGVARHQGKRRGDDLVILSVTSAVVDDIADMPGLGDAMAEAGWLEETTEGIVFPRFFEENNKDPGEYQREKNRERQKRYREKHVTESNVTRNVTDNVTVTPREEKRREEYISPPTPSKQTEAPSGRPSQEGEGESDSDRLKEIFHERGVSTGESILRRCGEMGLTPRHVCALAGWYVTKHPDCKGGAMSNWFLKELTPSFAKLQLKKLERPP